LNVLLEKYGAAGEKLSDAQLELFELEYVVSEMIERALLQSGRSRETAR